jgi:hypothetical protein
MDGNCVSGCKRAGNSSRRYPILVGIVGGRDCEPGIACQGDTDMKTPLVVLIDCGRASRKTCGLQFGPHSEGGLPPLTRYL